MAFLRVAVRDEADCHFHPHSTLSARSTAGNRPLFAIQDSQPWLFQFVMGHSAKRAILNCTIIVILATRAL